MGQDEKLKMGITDDELKEHFREQLTEDLKHIANQYGDKKEGLKEEAYAFNLWVQTNMYGVDEEVAQSHITDGSHDKSIDCFVHYKNEKKLFIIQCKYYSEKNSIPRKEAADFLSTPLEVLEKSEYDKRSPELQKIFEEANKEDSGYEIWLHFYITTDTVSKDFENKFKEHNRKEGEKRRCTLFTLSDIRESYYGENFKEEAKFSFDLKLTASSKQGLHINPEAYKMPTARGYYLIIQVDQIYDMYKKAKEEKYPIFEKNIREYLGKNTVNKKIMETLDDDEERKHFFYYNNGITIICQKCGHPKKTKTRQFVIEQPQIVNGCQTVNAIYEVLSESKNKNNLEALKKDYENTHVMCKILELPGGKFTRADGKEDKEFYTKVVKRTNSQTAINEKVFSFSKKPFKRLQEELKKRGFLLITKPSDRIKFKEEFKEKDKKDALLKKANEYLEPIGCKAKTLPSLFISLERILRLIVSFKKDGHYGHNTQGMNKLFRASDLGLFQSVQSFRIDNLIRLNLIDKKVSQSKKLGNELSACHLLGFISYFIEKEKTYELLNKCLDILFTEFDFNEVYNYFEEIANSYITEYRENRKREGKAAHNYTDIIKKEIDEEILNRRITEANRTAKSGVEFKAGVDFAEMLKKL